MPEAMPHPEFPMSIDAKVAAAVLHLLQADPALTSFFTAIRPYELEDLVSQDSFETPELALILDAVDENRSGANRRRTVETTLYVGMITTLGDRQGTQGWLRSRVFNQIKALLVAEGGVLRDAEGRRLTEALVSYQRLGVPRTVAGGGFLLSALRTVFTSDIHEATREFL